MKDRGSKMAAAKLDTRPTCTEVRKWETRLPCDESLTKASSDWKGRNSVHGTIPSQTQSRA